MRRLWPIASIGWSSSLAIHVGIVSLLGSVPVETKKIRPRSEVSFSVLPATQRAKNAATPAPQPPAEPVRPVPKSLTPAVARAAEPKVAPKPTPAPVDMTGVTLTGGEGAAWTSATGNGQAMVAPIVPTVAASPQPTREAASPMRPAVAAAEAAPEVVPVKDLSTKPQPPPLDSQLLQNYPPAARRQGLAGKAIIVARIDSDGTVRRASVSSESSSGFGVACQQTLLGTRWSIPRDKNGRAVSTQIYYTCNFRVEG